MGRRMKNTPLAVTERCSEDRGSSGSIRLLNRPIEVAFLLTERCSEDRGGSICLLRMTRFPLAVRVANEDWISGFYSLAEETALVDVA